MQIHDKFGLVTLVRTAFDFVAREPVAIVIARAAHPQLVLQEAPDQVLTQDEVAEFEVWRDKALRRASIQQAHAARNFAQTLAEVYAWLDAAPVEEATAFREETKGRLKRLARQIGELTGDDAEAGGKRNRPGKDIKRLRAKPPPDLNALGLEDFGR